MLQTTFIRIGYLRSWVCSSARLHSSDSKPPRSTRRKGKGPTNNRESANVKSRITPSTSELLQDFLGQVSFTKHVTSDKLKVEAVGAKDEKTRQVKQRISLQDSLQDKNTVKSMDLLRYFVNTKGQPSQKFLKSITQANRRSVRVRHTESLPQPAKLNLFDETSFQDYAVDESAYKNDIFNEINSLEASAYRAKSTHNHFEELIQWTLDGKLWKFPINNEQDCVEELNTPFHEHVFLNRYLKNKKSGAKYPAPLKAFMDLVCAGLGQNPYITAQQKKEHLKWFEDYFASKVKNIQAAVDEERRIAEAEAKARSMKS
nr:mitochondrial ribosomal protein s31 [Hymenolepis microstoma]CUU97438.1 mitochondrial ribosomal protein s31 [Hymenolepis microstoma]